LLVDVDAPGSLSLADVRVVASDSASGNSWTVDHAWSGSPLQLGVYLPKNTAGPVSALGCGYDSSNQIVAFGAGSPGSVAVQAGAATSEVTINLAPGAGAAGAAAACAGATDGGGGGGFLAISHAALPATVDLTAEGTLDWVHWGYPDKAGVNRKAGGEHPIVDLSPQGSDPLPTGGPTFQWTDGSPTASATTPLGVYSNYACVPPYFTWTVEATTTQRTLRLYISANTPTTLTAHLSDGSAPDAILTSSEVTADVSFRAATDGQTLTVTWTPNGTGGTFQVWAATLF
jgi:hypothetical protein